MTYCYSPEFKTKLAIIKRRQREQITIKQNKRAIQILGAKNKL
jgi:hypothetical protein